MRVDEQVALGEMLTAVAEGMGEQASEARLEIFTHALCDLPLDAVRAAFDEHVKASRFFPRPAEIRERAKALVKDQTRRALMAAPTAPWEREDAETKVTPAQLQEAVNDYLSLRAAGMDKREACDALVPLLKAIIPPARSEPWHHECEACEDTGWELRTCYPDQGPVCGVARCKRAAEHTYAVACGCRETNRTYQRKRAAGW